MKSVTSGDLIQLLPLSNTGHFLMLLFCTNFQAQFLTAGCCFWVTMLTYLQPNVVFFLPPNILSSPFLQLFYSLKCASWIRLG